MFNDSDCCPGETMLGGIIHPHNRPIDSPFSSRSTLEMSDRFCLPSANWRNFGVGAATNSLSFQPLTTGARIASTTQDANSTRGANAEDHEEGKRGQKRFPN